jgi:hypothetical protein
VRAALCDIFGIRQPLVRLTGKRRAGHFPSPRDKILRIRITKRAGHSRFNSNRKIKNKERSSFESSLMPFLLCFLLTGLLILIPSGMDAENAPLVWVQPDSFNPAKPHLGLPELKGVKHSLLYAPKASEARQGEYESLRHGLYNHHQQFLVNGNRVIVYWTNHIQDENGPGQRLLAKVGTIAADSSGIHWGEDETLFELAVPAMKPKRRLTNNNNSTIDGAFLDGELTLVNGKMYLRGRLQTCDGWTDDMRYHNTPLRAPVPEGHYRSDQDKKSGFRWDVYWFLGSFVQQFDFIESKLTATSPIYFLGSPIPEFLQITDTLTKKLAPLTPPYRDGKLLKNAPKEIQEIVATANRGRAPWQGHPNYAEGMFKRASNGKDGLAHFTEFQRPDGSWIAVRDNLIDSEVYYAATRKNREDTYPPGIRTNLFGSAMPVAGTLPDGSVWIVGSNRDRTDMFLTHSRDGITFDRTWSLLHKRERLTEGVSKPAYGGPQYFKTLTVGQNIYIVYSIGKESLGITEIPFSALR